MMLAKDSTLELFHIRQQLEAPAVKESTQCSNVVLQLGHEGSQVHLGSIPVLWATFDFHSKIVSLRSWKVMK